MSKINVWISSTGNPCEITNEQFYVEVLHCNGKILEWCGKRYAYLPTKCGHLELEVPPGCYIIRAAHWIMKDHPYVGNGVTHYGLVNACCEHTYCITLYNPGVHVCWGSLGFALNMLVKDNVLTGEVNKAMDAIKKEIDKLPITNFEKENVKAFDEMFITLQEKPKK